MEIVGAAFGRLRRVDPVLRAFVECWETEAFTTALSIPAGFTSDGHPSGLQLVARRVEEATLLDPGRVCHGPVPVAGA